MASRAGIDTKTALRLSQDHQEIKFALKAEFDTDTVLIHTGLGDLVIGGETYLGAGSLLAISDIEDSKELKSAGVTFSISGMDIEVLGYALNENYQNRPISLFMAFVSGGTDDVDGYLTLYKGRMINIDISDDVTGSNITLQTENRLLDLRRPSNIRYTRESQQYLYAGDTSLDQVTKISQMDIEWGRVGGAMSNSVWDGSEALDDEGRQRF
tara:strand:+ start:777 stop:1412 length:636 start_codon:yes stop_codon:yes gene_type:complete